ACSARHQPLAAARPGPIQHNEETMNHATTRPCALPRRTLLAAALLACGSSQAFEFDTGNPDLKIRWDNSVKYSAAYRAEGRSPGLSRTTFGPTGVVGPNNINQD